MTSSVQPTSWLPHSYQKDGVILGIKQACAGFFYKPGRGKTSVIYMILRILQEKGFVKKCLVICPLRPAYVVWPEQKNKYLEFQHLKVNVLHGPRKESLLADDSADAYIVNPEGLAWLLGSVDGQPDPKRVKYLTDKFQMLVVDESTKFKDTSTARFKLLKKVVGKFKRRYILTGSPRPKSLMNLFGQVYILDEGAQLGRYITKFRTDYFYPGGYGGYEWFPQPGAFERIVEKISPLVQVVDRSPEDPVLNYIDILVDLEPEPAKLYAQMENAMMLDVSEGRVVAANAAVASGKCRQVCNGAIFDESGKWHAVHSQKLEAIGDLVEQLAGEPVLITYEFTFDRTRLEAMFGTECCISTGDIKVDAARILAFSEGKLPLVIGQPQSVALGTDGLQNSCNTIIMMGCPWSFLNYEQVIDRIRRQGSKAQKVDVYRVLCRNTVDERVIDVLESNDREQASFMRALMPTT